MRFFLDISLILLIAGTVFFYWKRGFLRSVLGVAKTVVAVVLTYLFGARASAWLNEVIIGEKVTGYVHTRFCTMFEQGTSTFDLSRITGDIPEWLRTLFDHTTADVGTTAADYAQMTEASAEELRAMAVAFATPIANIISDLCGYMAVFLVSLLALTILAYILGKMAELPVIRTCDKLLGFLLGLLCAALFASTYVLLLFAVLSLIEGSQPQLQFHEAFESTVLFKRMYEYNVFRWIFGIG